MMFSVVSIFCYRLLLKSRNDKWAASLQKLIKIFGLSSKVQCCRGCWWFFWWRHQWNPEIKEILLGRYVCSRLGRQSKQLGRSKLGGILLNGLLSQISVSCLPTYFMRKRGKFALFTRYFPRSSSNCMNYVELGERSISRKNTILLPFLLLLPLVVVAWPFINFVSVQLSMITGKASIIILVVSTGYLVETLSSIHQQRNQSQQHSSS